MCDINKPNVSESTSRGKLIVIEGNEGVGKTLQSKVLRDKLEDLGIPVYLTTECSQGPVGKLIRDTFLSGDRKSDRRMINYLFAADRIDHITNDVDGMLHLINKGINVITDRYYMSSLALYAMEFIDTPTYVDEMRFIMSLNETARDLLPPDITIVIKMDPADIVKRLAGRPEKQEIYDATDLLTPIGRAYEDAITYLRERGDYICEVDGNCSTWKCHKQIIDLVLPILRGGRAT